MSSPPLPLPVSHADLELLHWDLTLRAVQAPLERASVNLAKAMWPRDVEWGSELKEWLVGESVRDSSRVPCRVAALCY